MRRSRFAKAIEVSEVRERASIKDALWFDVSAPETSDEEALCEWRLTGVQHAPVILGVTHLLITIAYTFLAAHFSYSSFSDNPFVAAVSVIALDVSAAALLLAKKRLELSPHTAFRLLCVYIGLAGVLWTWFGYTVADDKFITPIAAAPVAMAAGIAMRAIVSISSPPMALVNVAVSIGAAALLAGSPLVPVGVAMLSLVVFAYSIVGARNFIDTGRKRLRLEAQARKAQRSEER